MIVIPEAKPSLLLSLETDFGTTIARAIWKKIQEQEAWINANVPIGLVLWFFASQQYANGSPISTPNQAWKLCDGTIISNPDSPLNGMTPPDLRGKYFKFTPTSAGIGITGGVASYNLSHNHTGTTLYAFSCQGQGANSGGDHQSGNYHAHSISSDLGVFSLLPKYVNLQPYMRVL